MCAAAGQLGFLGGSFPVSYSGGLFKAGDLVLPFEEAVSALGGRLCRPLSPVEGSRSARRTDLFSRKLRNSPSDTAGKTRETAPGRRTALDDGPPNPYNFNQQEDITMYLTEQGNHVHHEALTKPSDRMLLPKEEIEAFFRQNPQRRISVYRLRLLATCPKNLRERLDVRPGASARRSPAGDYLVNPGYYDEELVKGSIVVALSRSGLTSEILRAVTHMKGDLRRQGGFRHHEGRKRPGRSFRPERQAPWAYDNSVSPDADGHQPLRRFLLLRLLL